MLNALEEGEVAADENAAQDTPRGQTEPAAQPAQPPQEEPEPQPEREEFDPNEPIDDEKIKLKPIMPEDSPFRVDEPYFPKTTQVPAQNPFAGHQPFFPPAPHQPHQPVHQPVVQPVAQPHVAPVAQPVVQPTPEPIGHPIFAAGHGSPFMRPQPYGFNPYWGAPFHRGGF